MPAPQTVLWTYKAHTAAKHLLLEKYLDAWFSIMGQTDCDLVYVDGFSGPGEYEGGELGSPLIALQRHSAARDALGTRFKANLEFWFIDDDGRRVKHLAGLVQDRFPTAKAIARVGEFAAIFPQLHSERSPTLRSPGMFAFIDPFGADGEATAAAAQIVALPRCEVLLYVPTGHIHRFLSTSEFRGRLATLDPHIDWDELESIEKPQRRAAIRAAFAAVLPCKWVRWFEITPAVGGNTYTMIFGTNNKIGLQRMKKAMWDVDPSGGAKFRDTTDAGQDTLFSPEPDYADLDRRLRTHFGSQTFSVQEALNFTLFATPYRDDAHLKTKVLAPAERSNSLRIVSAPPGRRPRTYKDPSITLKFTA